jgi:serine/threonine protein kinase
MIAAGTIIGGRYRVVRALGGGGMKMVYLAEDLRLAARLCALAEMVDSFSSPDAQHQAIAAFQREADMLARLSNEHIPRVIDRFSEANRHYLVMEYIDGVTLEDELKQSGGKLQPPLVIDIALQVLETLKYLHGLTPPVIYRDLKPSNIMVTKDGRAKLIDFGIARFFAPLSSATMIGTQGYAPPEQYRGKVEARSDLYALGATMHHALSGRDPAAEPPFSFPPLRGLVPDINPELAATVDQALAYDVVRRIPDASEFERRLLAVNNGRAETGSNQQGSRSAGRAQIPLPLGVKPAGIEPQKSSSNPSAEALKGTPTSSDAATAIIADAHIKCPRCARTIPLDSRFCSYCSAPLSMAAAPGDATVILSSAGNRIGTGPTPFDSPREQARRSRRRSGLRYPVLIFGLIIVTALFAMRQVQRTEPDSTAPSGYAGTNPTGPGASPLMRLQLSMLRQALDDQGYAGVHIGLDRNVVVLSGTIPSESDRANIQLICMETGVLSFRDNLRVHDERAGG